jgi:hypothetical protein
MGAGVGLIGAVAAVTALMIFLRGGGSGSGTGSGSGAGPGTGAPTTQTLLATQPTRPLKVTIQESNYLVSGRSVDLDAVTDLAAKVPAGSGPAVLVERSPSSRAKAENDLREALDKKSIPYASD